MLKDCLDVFKKIYDEEGEEFILDSYTLSEGSYLLVNESGNIDRILEVEKKDNDTTDEDYKYFKQLDYLSRLINTQKPIDSKKVIHSNNYLSFFIKKDNINRNKLKEEIIDGYYDALKNPLIKYKKEKAQMYKTMEEKYGQVDGKKLERCRSWIKQNIFSILESNNIKKDKNYLKIFFESGISEYREENEKYLIPNIYNNTDYNIEIDGKIYGLPNDNMNLNSKKPFLENRSRKNSIPYLIDTDEVLIQKKFFDYLENKLAGGKNNIYVKEGYIDDLISDNENKDDFTGYLIRIRKGKNGVEIHEFDTVTGFSKNIGEIYIDNILNIEYPDKYESMEYGYVKDINQLKSLVDSIYFNGKLNRNFFTKASDINIYDSKVKFNLLKYRQVLFNWFYKGNDEVIKKVFYNLSIDLIKNSIDKGRTILAKEQFNLMWGILGYFKGGSDMSDMLSDLTNSIRNKINNDITQKIDNDDEYYFLVGQLVSYLISRNKSNKKTHSLVNPILNCKNDEKLKDEIIKLFKKYSYDIDKGNKRFNNMSAMVLGYIPEEDVKEDVLLCGYLHNNLLYETRKKED
jgi:CRISPR-associated protein Csh1